VPVIESLSNNAVTSLTASITAGATTLTVASNSAFPQSGQFRIVIDSEVLIVTSGYGGLTWTVTRAAESTTGASHANNATVSHVFTAGNILNLGPSGSFTSIVTAGAASAQTVAANANANSIVSARFLGLVPIAGPAAGTWLTGDYGFDSAGHQWFCTAGGTPGTWVSPYAWGVLLNGYTSFAGSQGSISALVALTGLTLTVTPTVASRRTRISWVVGILTSGSATTCYTQLFEGATALNEAIISAPATATYGMLSGSTVIQPTAAAHTYFVKGACTGGTMATQGAATFPQYIMAEDLGGN
jgi:hypothetical protein